MNNQKTRRFIVVSILTLAAACSYVQAQAAAQLAPLPIGVNLGTAGTVGIGQMSISFGNLINPGAIWVKAVPSKVSPSGSILPTNVYPLTDGLLGQPIWITIGHSSALCFSDTVTLSFHIFTLDFNPGAPQRLFKSDGQVGSYFSDITTYTGPGSLEADGDSSSFSEFVIALDLRDPYAVIEDGLMRLSYDLEAATYSIYPGLYQSLWDTHQAARGAWSRSDLATMLNHLVTFDQTVVSGIQSNSFASQANQNIVGNLRSKNHNLNFLIRRVAGLNY